MSGKQQYLGELRAELRKYPSGAVDDYIEYYEELISERIEGGEHESTVLHHIGTPKEIAASFKQENALDRAVKKPTVSNGFKALIAVLGVLSLPLLLPVLAVTGVLLVVAAILVFVSLLLLACGVAAAVVGAADMTLAVIAGDAPFYLIPLTYGVALLTLFVAFELLRGLLFLIRKGIRLMVQKLHDRRTKRRHQPSDKEER
ncbi:MAG TPA: DUF1700 domain-containing protein [Candidatus Saccharimonadales bacterium]|nr:DUF1700 domain-containing protein [Candidatus Saccharimonadales bacterium]